MMAMPRSNWMRVFTLVAAVASVTGCTGKATIGGYSTGEDFDESIRSIAVPIFENRTFYRETEFKLTEALAKEIEARTPYKVTKAGSADTALTGTVINVTQRMLSRDRGTGLPQEVQVTVVVSFEWKDLRTGKVIRQRSRFEGTGEAISTYPAGEPIEVAKISAIQELAKQIVSVMRNDW